MQQGVVRVWTDSSRTVEIGQLPGNDYDFFSDMQRCVSTCPHGKLLRRLLMSAGYFGRVKSQQHALHLAHLYYLHKSVQV